MTEEVHDIACTVCGCVCDDLRATVEAGRVTAMNSDCSLQQSWFARHNIAPPAEHALISGKPVQFDDAVKAAARILREAKHPLIYGLSRSSTPGQRAAVRLADTIGAVIDTTASTCHGNSIMALQTVGESTCSLGEVRNRCDLVIYWGANPAVSHPRHMERYSLEPKGQFVPEGRAGRKLIVFDIAETPTARMADDFVRIRPSSDFEVLWALRALVAGKPLDVAEVGDVPLDKLRQLADQMKACRSGVFFFGRGLSLGRNGHAGVEALLRLTTDLNAHTRFYARRMRIYGDVAGADSVLTWQTGYPFSVNLARGYPRYNPGEYSAEALLLRGEVDACLMVGSDGLHVLDPKARERLHEIPTIALDYPGAERIADADVQFTTAIYGLHRAGTAYRMDEVPIPLRAVVPSPLPSDDEVLDAILKAWRA
ncbi:MAG: formylmethanofuran dehydrogenase subunit B [Planctomycetes bacterium]|nr:formylmethanofuran dehydrogenase subunit B [Planctomycetota bacterium]